MIEYIIGGAAVLFASRMAQLYARKYIRPIIKGRIGEMKSNFQLRKLPRTEYEVMKNLLLPAKFDTTQLDHVVLSPYGLFVVETKNYSGYVVGKEWDKEWMQYTDGKPQMIANPVLQNYKHQKALKQLLSKFSKVPIYSIVAISNRCQLDVQSELTLVVHQRDLASAIQLLSFDKVFSESDMDQIKEILERSNIKSLSKRRKHNALIRMTQHHPVEDTVSKAYEEGKDGPVFRFSPEPTAAELAFKGKLAAFKKYGAVMTIRGKTDTIEGFMRNARRNQDNTVADLNSPCDHIVCPFTDDSFPPSEADNLERGLWLTYLNKNYDLSQYAQTSEGFREMFPKKTSGALIVAAYVKDPIKYIQNAKETAWYRNIEKGYRRHNTRVDEQIKRAEGKKFSVSTSDQKSLSTYHHLYR